MTPREYAARLVVRQHRDEIIDMIFRLLSESKAWHGGEYSLADMDMDLDRLMTQFRFTDEQRLFLKQEQAKQAVEENWESA